MIYRNYRIKNILKFCSNIFCFIILEIRDTTKATFITHQEKFDQDLDLNKTF